MKVLNRRVLRIGLGVFLPVLFIVIILIAVPGRGILSGVPYSRLILDRGGEPLRLFLTEDDKYRSFRDLGAFPPGFIDAVLLQEDRHFYAHFGVNPVSIVRAAWQTYVKGERMVGGSTITMQTARMRYGLYTRSIPGKINQILRALILEIRYKKPQILEAYLNLVPCGGNIEGFPAAALYYFGKDISEISLTEQLLLAVIPQDPTERAPRDGRLPAELLRAREILADTWLKEHPDQLDLHSEVRMPTAVVNSFPFRTPHFAEYLNSTQEPSPRPLRSALHGKIQRISEMQLSRYIDQRGSYGISNGSVLVMDHTTGEVLAAVGSEDYFNDDIEGQVNGTVAKRSPGSTLKPFVYALAVEQGLIIPDTVLKDAPTSYSAYTPTNYQDDFRGAAAAWRALVDSRNVPAISLAVQLKGKGLYGLLAEAGISGLKEPGHYGLSIVLGGAEVTMMELAALYAALANGGIYRSPRLTLGDNADYAETGGRRILSEAASWLTLRMLEKNEPPYTYRPAESSGVPTAFKTGTSIGLKDAWAVAVVDRYVICVWIGNFSGLGNSAFVGRRTAAPLLFSIIDELLAHVPEEDRYRRPPAPENVREVDICPVSGTLPSENCPRTQPGWFIPGTSPIKRCDIHREIFIDTATGWRTDRKDAPGVVREVREFWPSDMLALFKEAGFPRLTPPPYAPGGRRAHAVSGRPPEILYPLARSTYLPRIGGERYSEMPLTASADADAQELFWFADAVFIGRTDPGGILTWQPKPGSHTLTVVDDRGRSASVSFDAVPDPSLLRTSGSASGSGAPDYQ